MDQSRVNDRDDLIETDLPDLSDLRLRDLREAEDPRLDAALRRWGVREALRPPDEDGCC